MIFTWLRNRRRRRLLAEPFPAEWAEIVARNARLVASLDDADRRRVEEFVRVFVAERYWEGCNGLEVTDEVRVTIAANAALLVLGFEGFYFDRLGSILVYPARYVAKSTQQMPGGVVRESKDVRLGEAWNRGPVVLAWPDVLEGGRNPDSGRNVVMHEFAHLLDMADDDVADGVPFLESEEDYATWTTVFERAYRQLVRDARRGRRTLLDKYGTLNQAEFFAVSTECFFERARLMARELPDLYAVLRRFYRRDPATWSPG